MKQNDSLIWSYMIQAVSCVKARALCVWKKIEELLGIRGGDLSWTQMISTMACGWERSGACGMWGPVNI